MKLQIKKFGLGKSLLRIIKMFIVAQIYLPEIFAVFKCKIDESIVSDPGFFNLKSKKNPVK